MKNIKRIGFVVFIAGIVMFTTNIFLGSYKIDADKIHTYFDATPNEFDKGDTVATGFLAEVENYHANNSAPTTSIFAFNEALPQMIDAYNLSISKSLVASEGITETELKDVIAKATATGQVAYSEEVLRQVFPNNENKVKLMLDNTSWMFSDQRTYEQQSEFEDNLNGKIEEVNKSIGRQYHISKEGWSLIDLSLIHI